MNRTLPEKYAYGLDKKGQGDLAYEQLDIETGDPNELSRAREEFFEQMYLQQEHGINLSDLQNETQTLKNEIGQAERGSAKKIRQVEANEKILVEDVPELLGHNKRDQHIDHVMKQYIKLQDRPDRKLTDKEVIELNKIFRGLELRPIPFGSYSRSAANRLAERLSQKAGQDFYEYEDNVRRAPKADNLRQIKGANMSVDDLEPAMNRRLKPRTKAAPPKPKLGKVLEDNNPKHIEAVSKYKKAQQLANETPFSKSRRIGKEMIEEKKKTDAIRKQIDEIDKSNQRKIKHAQRPISPRPPPPSAGGGGPRSTTQATLKSKQSPIVSPDSTSPKAKGTIDLASVRRSPTPRPWEDEDWMASNLGTADTPRHESSGKKSPRLTRA
jgi:hypothetical protein